LQNQSVSLDKLAAANKNEVFFSGLLTGNYERGTSDQLIHPPTNYFCIFTFRVLTLEVLTDRLFPYLIFCT
jgi:hypothetical protein